jgi:hypothetical protein
MKNPRWLLNRGALSCIVAQGRSWEIVVAAASLAIGSTFADFPVAEPVLIIDA